MIYLLLFVLLRDAMAPAGIWHISGQPVLWIRFARAPEILFLLGASSALLVLALQRFEPALARRVVWRKKSWERAVGWGLGGGILIGAPSVLLGFFISSWARGGAVPSSLWFWIAWVSFLGNWLEEMLFRGYLQGTLEAEIGAKRAVWASGLAFASAHALLAAQIGGAGAIVVVAFTLYEGLICAWVRRRDGVVAATVAHGLGIFLVATGIPG